MVTAADLSFSIWDLALWFAGSSLIMLVVSQLLAPHINKRNILIDAKRVRTVAILFSLAFIFTVGVKILTLTYN